MNDFKHFAHLKETKHDKIIEFFRAHEFGSSNPIMTYLSILTPVDRCVILEQLFKPEILNSWDLRDKIVLAYVKAGRVDLANQVIAFSEVNGDIDQNIYILKSKLDLGIPPIMENTQRLEIMYRELKKETGILETEFIHLLIDFISENNSSDNTAKLVQEQTIEYKLAKSVAVEIETKFKTKVLRYGVESRGTKEFESLKPFFAVVPQNAEYLFWLLVPIDESDYIVKTDYFKYEEWKRQGSRQTAQYYEETLKQDWDLTNYLTKFLNCQIYDNGGMKIESYKDSDNTIPDIEKIEDIKYRLFRFYN